MKDNSINLAQLYHDYKIALIISKNPPVFLEGDDKKKWIKEKTEIAEQLNQEIYVLFDKLDISIKAIDKLTEDIELSLKELSQNMGN